MNFLTRLLASGAAYAALTSGAPVQQTQTRAVAATASVLPDTQTTAPRAIIAGTSVNLSSWQTRNTYPVANPAAPCPAYPDFERPVTATPRVLTRATVDAAVRTVQQAVLRTGFDKRTQTADGLRGPSINIDLRTWEFFHGSAYGYTRGTDFNFNAAGTAMARYERDVANAAKRFPEVAKNKRILGALVRVEREIDGVNARALLDSLLRAGNSAGNTLTTTRAHFTTNGGQNPWRVDDAAWIKALQAHGPATGFSIYSEAIRYDQTGKLIVDDPLRLRLALDTQDVPEIFLYVAAAEMKAGRNLVTPRSAADTESAQIRRLRTDLDAIGFHEAKDGSTIRLALALREVQVQYRDIIGDVTSLDGLADKISAFATIARNDARRYGIADTGAIAAIHAAAKTSGLEFGYLMELAQAESGFDTGIKASTSSATGLYQFINQTWLVSIEKFGTAYGLGWARTMNGTYRDHHGRTMAYISNPVIENQVLDLRTHQPLSAHISHEFQSENKGKLSCFVRGTLDRTSLYTAHFLGAHDSVVFLNTRATSPSRAAAAVFPDAARANPGVYKTAGRDRSLEEVFSFFSKKFNTGRFERPSPIPTP